MKLTFKQFLLSEGKTPNEKEVESKKKNEARNKARRQKYRERKIDSMLRDFKYPPRSTYFKF